MSVAELVDEVRRGFHLEDQVSLTDLRQASWTRRLASRGKLRLTDRTNTIGVVVSKEMWLVIQEMAERLEALEDALEERVIEALWADRLGRERKPASVEGPRLLDLLRERRR